MSVTVHELVKGIRSDLGDPLQQSPSYLQIINELANEFQNITNETNNTGQAWQVGDYTLTTVVGQRQYEITGIQYVDFFKALYCVSVPSDVNAAPEYWLEFTEAEHLPQEWAWLSQTRGQYMYSSHDSQIMAFYRKLELGGPKLYCELRPTPSRVQSYRILYQQTDWFDGILQTLTSTTPHGSQKPYIRALVAMNLLLKGVVKWSQDRKYNRGRALGVEKSLKFKLERYAAAYEEYKRTLDVADVTYLDSWADEQDVIFY